MTVLYEDSLVRINTDGLVVKRFFLPVKQFGGLHVSAKGIEKIERVPLDAGSGKWRIWGSTTLTTWMPFDAKRASRGVGFVLHFKRSFFRVGFTVEDADAVTKALTDLNLLAQ